MIIIITITIEWRPWLPVRAPDPGLDPALMVNMIEESRSIRVNNISNIQFLECFICQIFKSTFQGKQKYN